MEDKMTLHICVGTACHQLGVQEVLSRLTDLLRQNGLEDRVEMKGMFCRENCNQAIFMQLDEVAFGHIRPMNVEHVFREEMLPLLLGEPVRDACSSGN